MWIQCNAEHKSVRQATLFARKFNIDREIRKAELRISSLGIFRVDVNGVEIDDYFMPGYTNYNKFVNLCSYDVASLLKRDNLISVTVADGWFAGRLGYTAKREIFGSITKLYAVIRIEYQDGDVEEIKTDAKWKAKGSKILYADFFNGETVDESLGQDLALDYDKMPNAVETDEKRNFEPFSMQPIRCVEKLSPIITLKDHTVFLDFKQNFAGVVSFKAKGKKGSKIVVRYSEALSENGELYVENLRSARSTDMLILGEKEVKFSPKFTYHGFRYAEISVQNGKLSDVEIEDIQGLVISQKLERTGYFECSDEIVNKIYQNTYWSQLSNFISVPTDCPQRDERLGWTGDAQIFCDTATYNADCNAFYKGYLDVVRNDCLENGSVPSFAPFFCFIDSNTHGCPCWGDAIAVIPYMHYLAYGDENILKENLPTAKRWVDYYIAHTENDVVKGLYTFGDWLSVEETTDTGVMMQCYFGYTLSLVAKMCRIIGEDEKPYLDLYERAKTAFMREYVSNGVIKSDTQTAYLVAYTVGFMSKEQVKDNLLRTIRRRNDTLTTGFIGVKFLLPVLCDLGEEELAYKMIKSTEYPSWGYSVVNGATTIWERWDGYTKDKGFYNPAMNSFNHYSLGSCVYWLYAYVLGIRLLEGDAKRGETLIKPAFNQGFEWVKGSYKMPKGTVKVEWSYKNEEVRFAVEIDGNVIPRFDFGKFKVVSKTEKENRVEILLKK